MTSLTAGQRLFDELEIDLDTIPTEQLDAYTSVEYFLILEDEPFMPTTSKEWFLSFITTGKY